MISAKTLEKLDSIRLIRSRHTTVSVRGLASMMGLSEDTILDWLREQKIPVYAKAGGLWINGQKTRWPVPGHNEKDVDR